MLHRADGRLERRSNPRVPVASDSGFSYPPPPCALLRAIIEKVPGVNCQETTREELVESLRVTLKEALEFNRREAIEAAGDSYDEQMIAL